METSIPNIRHLRIFLAVAECNSISKAIEKVFLSQPAITQAISKLEVSLGTVLFERKSYGMYLTEEGDVFAERVRAAMQYILDGIKNSLYLGGSTSQADQFLNSLTTSQLRALVAVTAVRNFSLAGRNLGIAQSSLHRSVRDLESYLGVVLIDKVSTGISPSKSAIALAQAIKLAFSEIEQGQEELFSLQNKNIGHIKIGSMSILRISILASSIIEFTKCYPDFRIGITDGPYEDLLYHLRHADLDFLVGVLRNPQPSNDILQEELFSLDFVIVVRAEHPYLSVKELTIGMLSESLWVVPKAKSPTRVIFDDFFISQNQKAPSGIIETGSQLLICSLLEDSDRMALISINQIEKELQDKRLAVLPFPVSYSRTIGIATRKGWRPTKAQQKVLDILRKQAKKLTQDKD